MNVINIDQYDERILPIIESLAPDWEMTSATIDMDFNYGEPYYISMSPPPLFKKRVNDSVLRATLYKCTEIRDHYFKNTELRRYVHTLSYVIEICITESTFELSALVGGISAEPTYPDAALKKHMRMHKKTSPLGPVRNEFFSISERGKYYPFPGVRAVEHCAIARKECAELIAPYEAMFRKIVNDF